MNEWISVKVATPKNGQEIYGYDALDWNGTGSKYVHGVWYEEENCLVHHTGYKYSFTHWMPLPDQPKEDKL